LFSVLASCCCSGPFLFTHGVVLSEEPWYDIGADHGEERYEVEPYRHEEEPEDLIDKVQELV